MGNYNIDEILLEMKTQPCACGFEYCLLHCYILSSTNYDCIGCSKQTKCGKGTPCH